MNWLILIIAGLFETSFAFCLGKAQQTSGKENLYWWLGFLVCLFLSMFLHQICYLEKKCRLILLFQSD
jgi:quaternary ammonium compound-resistance protein SugE